MRFCVRPRDHDVLFVIEEYSPEQNVLRMQGPMGKVLISMDEDFCEKLNCEIVMEDGTHAEFKELQARLQARTENSQSAGGGRWVRL